MKTKTGPIAAISIALCALLAVAACSAPTADVPFPDPTTATWKDGSFPNRNNLAQVQPGVSKHQMYELLGPPDFHEGVFHVRVWDYLLRFRKADGVVACQYQVQFDDDNRVIRTRWKDPECEQLSAAKP